MAVITQASAVPVAAAGRASRGRRSSARWIYGFITFQIACQLALLVPGIAPLRVVVRIAAFAASLYCLAMVAGVGRRHPAARWATGAIAILVLSIFHPSSNTILASVAQVGLYASVLAPLFWVARLKVDATVLRRTIVILWAFNTLSAGVGLLQVYFPGRFQPAMSTMITARQDYMESLFIVTASGERVPRPMGLTDTPGGAAQGGLYAVLFGLGFFFVGRRRLMSLVCIGSMMIGAMALYLSQVRATVVMTVVCLLVFGGVLMWRGKVGKIGMFAVLVVAVAVSSFIWAVGVGGNQVAERMATLAADNPTEIYYQNRGTFLEHTVKELLPQYPLGAGLGRWGMMNVYFGDNSDPARREIWSEIQWTSWLLDGGVPLIVVYAGALLVSLSVAWRIAKNRSFGEQSQMWIWAALILAYNVGGVALTFSYPLFVGTLGLQFWILNATLFAAAVTEIRARRAPVATAGRLTTHPVKAFS